MAEVWSPGGNCVNWGVGEEGRASSVIYDSPPISSSDEMRAICKGERGVAGTVYDIRRGLRGYISTIAEGLAAGIPILLTAAAVSLFPDTLEQPTVAFAAGTLVFGLNRALSVVLTPQVGAAIYRERTARLKIIHPDNAALVEDSMSKVAAK